MASYFLHMEKTHWPVPLPLSVLTVVRGISVMAIGCVDTLVKTKKILCSLCTIIAGDLFATLSHNFHL